MPYAFKDTWTYNSSTLVLSDGLSAASAFAESVDNTLASWVEINAEIMLIILANSVCIPNSSATVLSSSWSSLRRSPPSMSSICSSLFSSTPIGITRYLSPVVLGTCIFSNRYQCPSEMCIPMNGNSSLKFIRAELMNTQERGILLHLLENKNTLEQDIIRADSICRSRPFSVTLVS